MFTLSERSRERLQGVHPDLVKVIELAITRTDQDFAVGEGVRSSVRQAELVKSGKSRTMKSRHLKGRDGFGHAVDLWALADGKVTWDHAAYARIWAVVSACAAELGVALQWGGILWAPGFIDADHFQLSKENYPD